MISAGVITANIIWNRKKVQVGIVVPLKTSSTGIRNSQYLRSPMMPPTVSPKASENPITIHTTLTSPSEIRFWAMMVKVLWRPTSPP